MKECSVNGCDKVGSGRKGLCSMHYTRLNRRGDLGSAAPERGKYDLSQPCQVPSCGRIQVARGYCQSHYNQVRQHGRVVKEKLKRFQKDTPPIEWFEQNTSEAANGCIEWLAGKTTSGYGTMRVDGRPRYAHRFIYEHANGHVDPDLVVDHKCGNPSCVNIDHLHLVTQKQNNENRVVRRDSASGIRGVRKDAGREKGWRAEIRHHGKAIYVGRFYTSAEAETAVKKARAHYFTNSLSDEGWRSDDVRAG